jgi:hypothetical protein
MSSSLISSPRSFKSSVVLGQMWGFMAESYACPFRASSGTIVAG